MSSDGMDDEIQTPATSFPRFKLTGEADNQDIGMILINSDANECNNNLCTYMKIVVDKMYRSVNLDSLPITFHELSIYAFKLLNLNMFVKNYMFCIHKIMGLISVFTELTEAQMNDPERAIDERLRTENEYYKEFVSVCLLLLLKTKNASRSKPSELGDEWDTFSLIDDRSLYLTLRDAGFVKVVSDFISTQILASQVIMTQFFILEFTSDIFFEYLYYNELLCDSDFHILTNETHLIQVLIRDLLSNETFDHYDISDDYLFDTDKQKAYQEFKLLLLINEQYMMKSYTSGLISNQVFEGLMTSESGEVTYTSEINAFINLLIFNLNREESEVIKILILKFLYLVFTTSYTSKLFYLNDLKILLDIFIRDLNNIDIDESHSNKILVVTYLKVLYPLLMFSQLNELKSAYKVDEIKELLSHLIMNSPSVQGKNSDQEVISKLALRCLSASYLKPEKQKSMKEKASGGIYSSTSPYSSASSLSLGSHSELNNDSTDSVGASFTRVASVRVSTRADYEKLLSQDLRTNTELGKNKRSASNLVLENNHNIFLNNAINSLTINNEPNINLERKKYDKVMHPLSIDVHENAIPKSHQCFNKYKHKNSSSTSTSSTQSSSLLVKKAQRKKAPPPPPPPPRRRF
ncbi:uncharacterized protein PRCAT00003686001 [Priceomyces carsonii]|uniref:uncharacterized protein n=1 Tax=Priceomyces carsonii TaxID=28549 RepID=UPI002ED8DADA|nr:unnamed protein product [Priceomyces carsonii]